MPRLLNIACHCFCRMSVKILILKTFHSKTSNETGSCCSHTKSKNWEGSRHMSHTDGDVESRRSLLHQMANTDRQQSVDQWRCSRGLEKGHHLTLLKRKVKGTEGTAITTEVLPSFQCQEKCSPQSYCPKPKKPC